jgi:tRNA pseudouridine38-40 synthase
VYHYLLWIRYDGTDFHGWQRQTDLRSVQGELESALKKVVGDEYRMASSSRTDSGVHALRHPVGVKTPVKLPPVALFRGMNSVLPMDMAVVDVQTVPLGFNARKSAVAKTYRYRVLNQTNRDPFIGRYAWHVPYRLDVESMREAAQYLVGEHDFSAFRAADCDARSPRRRVHAIVVERNGSEIIFTLHGNAFLRNMVRIIVGNLVTVGRGRLTPAMVKEILDSLDRTKGAQTAPARGLTLMDVDYPMELVASGALEW